MRTMTATSASRGFSDLLDAVEHGDTITITRGGHAVAELRPARRHTVGALRERLADAPALDPAFETDIADAMTTLDHEITDPWADA